MIMGFGDLGWPAATLLEFPKLQKLTNWRDLGENGILNVHIIASNACVLQTSAGWAIDQLKTSHLSLMGHQGIHPNRGTPSHHPCLSGLKLGYPQQKSMLDWDFPL